MMGIKSWGGYVARLRLERKAVVAANRWANGTLATRSGGSRAFCNWDEDALTMGVEAGRACLARAPAVPERLVFASTTPPFLDRPSAVLAAAALQLDPTVRGVDQGGSQRAGSSALLDALERGGTSLVIAADTRHAAPGTTQELSVGDGAAALLVGSGDGVARFLGGVSHGADFVDHFRTSGEHQELHWEERWIRDEGIGKLVPRAIGALLREVGVETASIRHFIFPTMLPKLAESIAIKAGLTSTAVRDDFAGTVGETGTAHALLMLAAVLDVAQPGERILLVTFGFGCDAILLETTAAVSASQGRDTVQAQITAGVVEPNYQKFLSFKGEVALDFGLRFEVQVPTQLTAQYRRGMEMTGFLAGRCPECGTIQFPRAGVCVNAACDRIGAQTPVSLLGIPAQVVSFTSDWLSFKGAPPFCFGLVQFENGARVLMELVDFTAEQLRIGAAVRCVYRKKEIDVHRRYHSYFLKAAPAV